MKDMKNVDSAAYGENYDKAVKDERVDELKLGSRLIAITKK
jgi:hypothetical protein